MSVYTLLNKNKVVSKEHPEGFTYIQKKLKLMLA